MKPQLLKISNCPSCSKEIPQYEGEGSWCNHCEWNMSQEENEPRSRFEKYHDELGRRISQSLFDGVMSQKIKYGWNFSKILTISICLLALSSPILMIYGSYLAYFNFPILGFAITLIPCLGSVYIALSLRIPKPDGIIKKEDAPELNSLFSTISAKINNTHIDHICINHEFNASYTERGIGPFKKRYVTLGIPLVEILEADELIAVISHEISHGANGDVGRRVIMYRAQHLLAEYARALSPQEEHEGLGGHMAEHTFWVIVGNYLGHFASLIPYSVFKFITWLSFRDSQAAEYLADLLATRASGKSAMIRLQNKLRFSENYVFAVSRVTLSKGRLNLYEELRRVCLKPKSDHAVERLNRLELKKGLSLDASHPPLVYREEFIEKQPEQLNIVKISDDQFKTIKKEFAQYHDKMAERIIDEYLIYIS